MLVLPKCKKTSENWKNELIHSEQTVLDVIPRALNLNEFRYPFCGDGMLYAFNVPNDKQLNRPNSL